MPRKPRIVTPFGVIREASTIRQTVAAAPPDGSDSNCWASVLMAIAPRRVRGDAGRTGLPGSV